MRTLIRQTIGTLMLLSLITGLAYPLLVTVVAQVAFPGQANGSLIVRNGKVVGSELIGQPFSDPRYFWSRPSATSPIPYNAANSSGSNLGPLNPTLADNVSRQVTALRTAGPAGKSPVPVDLVTSSASGLDPDISPASAEYQVPRVAKARHMDETKLRALVAANTHGRQLGFLGEPRVNVLMLNLALDRLEH
ncbi:MAG: potassium-transporting ATPase subunit KdpC [Phycisphaerae bacterium]